jgi:DNA-binding FrmR family transcriptional regulator
MQKERTLKRLRNVGGHIRGIERMVEADGYCVDVIRQIQAAQAALGKVAASILEDHLHTCLTTAVRGDDPAERERVLTEIAQVYAFSARGS